MKLANWRQLLGLRPRVGDLARQLIDAARECGNEGWSYDEQGNLLRHESGSGVLNLANIFLEYSGGSSASGRAALIEKYVSMMADVTRETPELWTLAAKAIYPVVRSIYDTATLEMQARHENQPLRRAVSWPLAGDLMLRLVYDHGASLAHVYEETLQTWGQPADAVKQKAFDNLRALQRPSWQAVAPGVQQLISEVSYEESLFLVDAVADKLPFAASVVVMPVNRGVLLAADGNSSEAVVALLAEAARALREKPWPLSATLLHRPRGEWVEFTPSGVASEQTRALRQLNLHDIYADQAEALQRQLGEEVFVGTFSLLQKGEGLESVRSWCTWTQGVRTSMPKTDLVILGKEKQGQPDEAGESLIVEWSHLSAVCGERMRAAGERPERFMVESFPDDVEWQQLKSRGEVLRA